jgi:tetratricopeptide (TPR) repeat protein
MVVVIGMVCAPSAMAQEVVQQLPGPANDALADALRRLSRNPDNVAALVDAGNASLALGDVPAALGFFSRAQARRPEDGAVLTGLALVAVRRGEGTIAVQLFDNANAAGAALAGHAAERGLAYDLIGNNARAQRLYRQALSREESDEVIRRLALSYAISGDGAASEATLLPLLQRQDRSAWRSRAFALAIMGQDEEAITIAETMLPQRLSLRLAPYLRYMPQLTRAQQAAAANLGRFPSATDIGRDTPQIAALDEEADEPAAPTPSRSDRLTPIGAPLGSPAASATPAAPAALRVASGELPALATATSESPAVSVPAPAPAREPAEARPSIALVTPTPPPEQVAEPAGEQAWEQNGETIDLAEAFADFTLPAGGLRVAPSAGAVDVTAIEPAREAPPAPAPAPPPAHPSRHWVQVATGQDLSAFRFDWRRIVRNADGLLDGREAYTARWNQTNRLVTGPFESAREADRFVAQLDGAGIDAFRFTSAEGEQLRPID